MLKCLMSTTETKMSKKNSVKFQQILAWLMTEVMFGKAHSDGVIEALAAFRTAPRFFDMTLGAHVDSAQMTQIHVKLAVLSLFSARPSTD
jgi:hypothetical protein